MKFALHKAPRGLLELFRLRNFGTGPQEFESSVQPVVDVSNFYGADLLGVTTALPTVGGTPNLAEIVPLTNAPAWRLRGLAGRLTVGAAPFTAGGVMEIGITLGPANTNITLQTVAFGIAAAAAQIGVGVECNLVLENRWSLYAVVNGTAAGVDHSLLCMGLVEPLTLNG